MPLLSPTRDPALRGTLTERAMHPRELHGRAISAQRGGTPRESRRHFP